jgi:predicted GNAT family N-acyltransferase
MEFRIVHADWDRHAAQLRYVRRQVFIEEQGVPEDKELDGRDAECAHVLALDGAGQPVGAGRLERSGKLGRMAVLPGARGAGVGAAMLNVLKARAAEWGVPIVLHAQQGAIAFYARHGFVTRGEPFEEAGIVHREMVEL